MPPSDRVVIAIDPHKASWTASAVNATLQPLDTLRVPVNRDGYRRLRRFARRWPGASWAIEGASGLGAALLTRLTADGVEAVRAGQAGRPGVSVVVGAWPQERQRRRHFRGHRRDDLH